MVTVKVRVIGRVNRVGGSNELYENKMVAILKNIKWHISAIGHQIYSTQGFVYAPQQYRQVLLRARTSYGNSVRPSVCLSRPGTDSMPGQIETPGLHHMIA